MLNLLLKKARSTILISHKRDSKTKTVTEDKKGHYIIIKGIIQQKDRATVNLCSQHGSIKIHKRVNNKHKGT